VERETGVVNEKFFFFWKMIKIMQLFPKILYFAFGKLLTITPFIMQLFSAIRFGLFLSLFSFALISCQKDGVAPPPIWSGIGDSDSGVSGSMTSKVDGSQWTAANNMAGASIINDISNVTGTNSSSSTITITINEAFILNGTYDLGLNSENVAAYISSNGSGAWITIGEDSSVGTVFISALDTTKKLISGSFEFDGYRLTDSTYRHITEGQFTNLTFSTSTIGPSENLFMVDIDGQPFTPSAINGILNGSNLMITAANAQGTESVALNMPNNIEPGTYDLGSVFFSDYSGLYNQNTSIATTSDSGTLTITTHDTGSKFIEGTFSFISSDFAGAVSFELTNGEFSVNY